ncbi:XRE family transcriptional regulator [Streptomyces sp. HNM0574]|uniref:XRE family transcriptional regulator n=1 Tax=Streptomyces sp. HNM0574 TaxID=2714954 RepID=UPI00146A9DB8|nr:XRE family transcriptional regulator [Streptomyces sp. HNM0574]NLU67072.1 XRE family transcriptional regulator [Streptomyces sp. HNM0574]
MHHGRPSRPAPHSSSPLDAAAARRLREALGMTPQDVAYGMRAAYGAQVTARTVAAWEAGLGTPDESQLTALAGALWCSPADLLSRPTTLREHRLAGGMAVADVARAIGMDAHSYERAEETGAWTGNDGQAALLAHTLGLPPDAALALTGKADRLARLLRDAVTARWQPYLRPVGKLVPLEREELEVVLRALHEQYQSTTAASLSWAADDSSEQAREAGRVFLADILEHFWSEVGGL